MPTDTLPPDEVKIRLQEMAAAVNAWLAASMEHSRAPHGLVESMAYSLLAGGKRLRPALCLTSAALLGLPREQAMPFAAALECIHTYSLIHDDLPAMDDDDLRRGRPSNHKQFDEATAILAGDGLLTDAFALMASCAEHGIPAGRVLRAICQAAEAAGSPGMVGGQFLDMCYTKDGNVGVDTLAAMHALKTGALIRASCACGAVLAGADEAHVKALTAYGASLGIAFQIADDILDETGNEQELGKPVGSDAEQGKTTYPSLLGLAESRKMAIFHAQEACRSLRAYQEPEAALLRGLALYTVNRLS